MELQTKSRKVPVNKDSVAGIGRRIREVRGALSQDEFCKYVGLPKRTLIRYEAEQTYPTAETLGSICAIFQIDPEWLLLGTTHTRAFSIPHTARLMKQ